MPGQTKNILVTGATGKQGGSVIDALANNPDFTLLAVTRNASSGSASKLQSQASNIKLVQGDQDDVSSLFAAASKAADGQPIWGVYSVQISQGKGVTHDGEIRQGKGMIDEAVKAGVKHFVYSSVERGGDEKSWDTETPIPHFQSKYVIERYLREKAGSQMGWTVLRPVAFMDNLAPGFPTQVFMAAMRDTLAASPNKKNQWIATADIGVFAKLAFASPDKFNHRAIGLAGDELTSEQLSRAFKNKTGNAMDGTFWFLGSFLKYMVAELGTMINWFGSDGYRADIAECRRLHPGLMDMETWIQKKSAFHCV